MRNTRSTAAAISSAARAAWSTPELTSNQVSAVADGASRWARALAAAGMISGDGAPVSVEHDRFLAEAYLPARSLR